MSFFWPVDVSALVVCVRGTAAGTEASTEYRLLQGDVGGLVGAFAELGRDRSKLEVKDTAQVGSRRGRAVNGADIV